MAKLTNCKQKWGGGFKSKGFTLIELLAVIVVLAIIALIATPIVLNIIDNSKASALKDSVYGIVDSAKLEAWNITSSGEDSKIYTVTNGKLLNGTNELKISGKIPSQGSIKIYADGRSELAFYDSESKKCAVKSKNDSEVLVGDTVLTDKAGKEVCSLTHDNYTDSNGKEWEFYGFNKNSDKKIDVAYTGVNLCPHTNYDNGLDSVFWWQNQKTAHLQEIISNDYSKSRKAMHVVYLEDGLLGPSILGLRQINYQFQVGQIYTESILVKSSIDMSIRWGCEALIGKNDELKAGVWTLLTKTVTVPAEGATGNSGSLAVSIYPYSNAMPSIAPAGTDLLIADYKIEIGSTATVYND